MVFLKRKNKCFLMNYKLCVLCIFCVIITFSACLPVREGRVKLINTGGLKKGDTVYFYNGMHTYATFGNPFTGSAWDPPTPEQKGFEYFTDSVQESMAGRLFKIQKLDLPNARGEYKIRPFVYRERIGKIAQTKSDSISWVFSNCSWGVKDKLMEQAYGWLPDTIKLLSYKHPVLFFTNNHYFWQLGFVVGYSEGVSNLNWRITAMAVAVYKGAFVYFRSFKKRYNFKNAERDYELISHITGKVLDKLK
jgi:hypothetical protein